jgi:hypothetical protein
MIDKMTKGYRPIAVRDDRAGNTVISYNTEERKFLISVTGKLAGPFTMKELEALNANLNDIIEMKGSPPLFIQDYDVRGNRND